MRNTKQKPPVIANWKMILFVLLLLPLPAVIGNTKHTASPVSSGYVAPDKAEEAWVQEIFDKMSPEERLGQLIVVRAYSNKGSEHTAYIERMIRKYHVGNLCFFQGTPERQIKLINRYQPLTQHVPLMISMDAEWGLGMRMKSSTISFPRQLLLGAIQDNDLIYKMGIEVARQLKRVGVHVNFAPVVDINNNAANPVINTRSFGEDRYNVSVKSYMYMKGMQDNGVMASAKHFPGHGDTNVDSHYDLPVIPHDRRRLDSIELYPFKVLARHNIGSIMVGHLHVPSLDDRENRATSLSSNTITNTIKKEMKYEGLIFTDGLGMRGVTKHFGDGEVEAEALLAGNDLLLLPQDVGAAIRAIKRYLEEGKLQQQQLDESVKKVLRAKYRMGLTSFETIPVEKVREDLNSTFAQNLKRELVKNALTMVRNKDQLVPFQELNHLNMASLSIGSRSRTLFQERLSSYAKMTHLQSSKDLSADQQDRLINMLQDKDVVIIGLHDMSNSAAKNFGIRQSTLEFINRLNQYTKVVVVAFGSPYGLQYFDEVDWLLCTYTEDKITQDLAAQGLFGVFGFQGRLPVTASDKSACNMGVATKRIYRMGYAPPESVGLHPDTLAQIDELAKEAIRIRATPGCVVLIAKEGQIVYHKAFGHHTYEKRKKVAKEDLYDLASMTKILATTLSIMKLSEEGLLEVEQPLSNYLAPLRNSNKVSMTVKDIMAHRAGLQDWIPFYQQTVSKSRRNPRPLNAFYRAQPNELFNVPVTDRLYLRSDYRDSIWQQIIHSKIKTGERYVYSDLGFYLLSETIEELSGQPIDEFAANHFYKKMGLQTVCYNPWEQFSPQSITPSEYDTYFRRQRVQGYVHDMGAAMLGGISGHAGLFANANDVAVLMQLLLQGGHYGGTSFIQPSTIEKFTTRHPKSTRRGLGFDMKQTSPDLSQNMAQLASKDTFGHTGFTGTCSWADPQNELIFVFLSNRTYPSMRNWKLVKENFRENMQDIAYRAITSYE